LAGSTSSAPPTVEQAFAWFSIKGSSPSSFVTMPLITMTPRNDHQAKASGRRNRSSTSTGLVSDGHLSGVIDFDDLTCGDPATDLAVLWMLPPAMRSSVEAWESDEPEALMVRVRAWALALGLA
jgi:hypothetical protein